MRTKRRGVTLGSTQQKIPPYSLGDSFIFHIKRYHVFISDPPKTTITTSTEQFHPMIHFSPEWKFHHKTDILYEGNLQWSSLKNFTCWFNHQFEKSSYSDEKIVHLLVSDSLLNRKKLVSFKPRVQLPTNIFKTTQTSRICI